MKLYKQHEQTNDLVNDFAFPHLMAMTKERLHSKAEIAEELGYRDMQIKVLREQLAKVTSERDTYKLALVEIESPIKIMQQRAKVNGTQINGQMAVALSNDAYYLKDLATTALRKQANEVGNTINKEVK